MDTVWTRDLIKKTFPLLIGEKETDTLIIGGGMAGILCANELKNAGVDCIVLEADRVGMGITSGTTAVISAQHSVLYSDLTRRYGPETAKGYLEANLAAVKKMADTAWGIGCDFEMCPSMMYSRNNAGEMRREAEIVQRLGFQAQYTETVPLGIEAAGAVIFPGMAQFHPLKFLLALADKLTVFERSPVQKIRDMTAFTPSGSVRAKNIVIATHFPFIDRGGLYFMKMCQMRESVMVVENAPKLTVTMVEDAEKGFFFRSWGECLIIGCGNHQPGQEENDFSRIRSFLNEHIPGAREICRWVNQDCFTLDEIPYIGRCSPSTPNIFVAAGFNAWGMSSSMAAACILTDAILGRENKYAEIFDPSRRMEAKPLIKQTLHSAAGLLTPTFPRCTHLGCALKHNDTERSWDCPCHGSRFTENGQVINGPAVKPLKTK